MYEGRESGDKLKDCRVHAVCAVQGNRMGLVSNHLMQENVTDILKKQDMKFHDSW